MSYSKIKAVIFDHDDTLVETIKPKWAQHQYIAKTYYNKELEEEEIRKHWGKPFSTIVQLLYETQDVEEAFYYNNCTRHLFPKKLFPVTSLVLEQLRKAKKTLGIVTSTTKKSLDYDFSTLPISKSFFSYIQTEEDTAFHKPHPEVFQKTKEWLASIQITPEEVLYIGDCISDAEAAKGAGFHFLGVCSGLTQNQDFASKGLSCLPSLQQLPSTIIPTSAQANPSK